MMADNNFITRYDFANLPEHRQVWEQWKNGIDAIDWAASYSDIERAALQEDWFNMKAKAMPWRFYDAVWRYVHEGKIYW